MSRPKSPCGTPAAAARHRRNYEPIDDDCLFAEAAARRARKHGVQAVEAVRGVQVAVVDGALTLTVTDSDDARMLAAAVGDRAYALDHAPQSQRGASDAARRARSLHKRMMSALRTAGVGS